MGDGRRDDSLPPDHYQRPLAPGWILREAGRTFRDRFWWVMSVAAVVTVVTSVADALAEWATDGWDWVDSAWLQLALVLMVLFSTGSSTLGSTLLAGMLDLTVGEHQHGHRRRTFVEVLHHIPWVTLILADALVALVRVTGFVLLIVPGFAAITLTAVVGPVVMLERRGPVVSVRRSMQLVWPSFWLVLGLVTVPLVGEAALAGAVDSLPFVHGLLAHLVTVIAIEVPVATGVALIEVTLAYHLIERDRPGTIEAAAEH